VSGEDVIIGKTTPLPQDDNASQAQHYTKCDQSTCLCHSESGMIDQVFSLLNYLDKIKLYLPIIRVQTSLPGAYVYGDCSMYVYQGGPKKDGG